MKSVWHLMGHDVRVHWRLMVAWTLLLAAHPIVAVLASPAAPMLGGGGTSTATAAAFIGARLVLCAVLVIALVQQDAPHSDLASWRTKPISPVAMATAKGITVAAATLLLPVIVVLTVAALAEVPLADWPGIALRIVATDGALVGVVLASAAFTRHASTALVTVVGVLAGAILIFGTAARVTTRMVDHTGRVWLAADPFMALPTLVLICAVTSWTVALLAWSGHRRRRAMLAVVAGGAVALLAAWYVPAARLHHRETPAPPPTMTLRLSSTDVRARTLPGGDRQVALLTTYDTEGSASASVERLWLSEGRLDLGAGTKPARGLRDPTIASPSARREALVGVVSAAEFATAMGRRARFRGRFQLETRLGRVIDAGPLSTGLHLVSRRATFRGAATASDDIAVARGALTVVSRPMAPVPGIDFFLRESQTGTRVGPLFVWHARTALSYLALLPTLTRPFEWDTVELRLPGSLSAGVDVSATTLELQETTDPNLRLNVDATLEFTVPAAISAPDTPAQVRR